jgi:hypothetical protein
VLRLWVRIPPGAWISVVSIVLSVRGLFDELITRPEECVVVCDLRRNLMNEEALAQWGLLHKKKSR